MELSHARELAIHLMSVHGLLGEGWVFHFNRAVRMMGVCKYATRAICLSTHFVQMNDAAHVEQTILHEIAHALAGKDHGHDAIWRMIARKLGVKSPRATDKKAAMPSGRYIANCPRCGVVGRSHRRPKYIGVGKYICRKCKSHVQWAADGHRD